MAQPNRRPVPPRAQFDQRSMRLERPFRLSLLGGVRSRWLIDDGRHTRIDGYIPEPDVELEGAELSDAERHAAISREAMRRELRQRKRGTR